jgi:hypothetical protein
MKKANKWEKPDLSVLARSKSARTIASFRNNSIGSAPFNVGPAPEAIIGPAPDITISFIGPAPSGIIGPALDMIGPAPSPTYL